MIPIDTVTALDIPTGTLTLQRPDSFLKTLGYHWRVSNPLTLQQDPLTLQQAHRHVNGQIGALTDPLTHQLPH